MKIEMTFTDWTGFIGVAVLLLAYFLHLQNIIQKEEITYLLLNFAGAAMACFASILLNYWPFIVLEGCWAVVSAVGLFNHFKKIVNHRKYNLLSDYGKRT